MPDQKTDLKISSIRQACRITDSTMDFISSQFKEGVTEIETVKEINKYIKKQSDGIAFRTIVAFGKNSAEIHHQYPSKKKLKKGDFIMLDFGAKVNGYCSDITRTFVFGKPSKEQKKIFKTVLNAQKKAIEALNEISFYSKIDPRKIDRIARDYIVSKGYPNIPHSLGHGVGKKVHSGFRISPKSKSMLKSGMVFSIEPGIYIKGFGGVRIEDLILLKDDGIEILTKTHKKIEI